MSGEVVIVVFHFINCSNIKFKRASAVWRAMTKYFGLIYDFNQKTSCTRQDRHSFSKYDPIHSCLPRALLSTT